MAIKYNKLLENTPNSRTIFENVGIYIRYHIIQIWRILNNFLMSGHSAPNPETTV
jgi:hypothetical protein